MHIGRVKAAEVLIAALRTPRASSSCPPIGLGTPQCALKLPCIYQEAPGQLSFKGALRGEVDRAANFGCFQSALDPTLETEDLKIYEFSFSLLFPPQALFLTRLSKSGWRERSMEKSIVN